MRLKTKSLRSTLYNNFSLFGLFEPLNYKEKEDLKLKNKHTIIFKNIKNDEDFNYLCCIIPFECELYTKKRKSIKIQPLRQSSQYKICLFVEFIFTRYTQNFDISKHNSYISFAEDLFFGVMTKEYSICYFSKILNVSLSHSSTI